MKLPSLRSLGDVLCSDLMILLVCIGAAISAGAMAIVTSRFTQLKAILFAAVLALAGGAAAQDFSYSAYMELPAALREIMRNPDGSCVQCSNGMVGEHNNLPAWTFLLFDTEYGPAVHGGSWPGRVADYAKRRGMRLYNVTGNSYGDTRPWMIYAAKTNRFAAIGAGGSHFQTLYGYIPGAEKPWLVCNNNSPQTIDEYTEQGFRRLHEASGPWVIVPDEPSPAPPPRIVPWWQK